MDIRFPPVSAISEDPPFVQQAVADEVMNEGDQPRFDETTYCPVYDRTGECQLGLKCRFLGAHGKREESGQVVLIVDDEKKAIAASTETELNFVDADDLKNIRTKKVSASYSILCLQCTDM